MVQRTGRSRDAESSRAALLEAATRVFARRGFAGATMQEISDEAGLKKPLIYHYFGSKEGLYSAVKASIVGQLPDRMPATTFDPDLPEDLPVEVHRLFELLRDHERLFRINAWACLEGDSGLGPEVVEHVLEMRRRIEQAQVRGKIRWTIDLETLSLMLIGLASFGPQIRARIANDCGRGPDADADADADDDRRPIALTIEGRVSPP